MLLVPGCDGVLDFIAGFRQGCVALHFVDDVFPLRVHLVEMAVDGTSQTDQIVVSRNGLFVVETKNLKVWIFGNAKQCQWTTKI